MTADLGNRHIQQLINLLEEVAAEPSKKNSCLSLRRMGPSSHTGGLWSLSQHGAQDGVLRNMATAVQHSEVLVARAVQEVIRQVGFPDGEGQVRWDCAGCRNHGTEGRSWDGREQQRKHHASVMI